jgi:hypothetical protein
LAVAEVVERTGVPLDTGIDYTPLPLHWVYGGLSFVALQMRPLPSRWLRKIRADVPRRIRRSALDV